MRFVSQFGILFLLLAACNASPNSHLRADTNNAETTDPILSQNANKGDNAVAVKKVSYCGTSRLIEEERLDALKTFPSKITNLLDTATVLLGAPNVTDIDRLRALNALETAKSLTELLDREIKAEVEVNK